MKGVEPVTIIISSSLILFFNIAKLGGKFCYVLLLYFSGGIKGVVQDFKTMAAFFQNLRHSFLWDVFGITAWSPAVTNQN